ncbi:MAG: MOSC domain-containing protein [Micavibrio sp.]|nr:MAG: MOSC domain-containing protein [Micavibrio sp.]
MGIRVAACRIYPLKSAAGYETEQMEILPRGPKGDREWLLVNEENGFLTQRLRGCEKMPLIGTAAEGGNTVFSAPAMPPLTVAEFQGETQVTIWKDTVTAQDAGNAAAAWFSEYLGMPCRLVRLSEKPEHRRKTSEKWGPPDGVVGFADGFPLLVTNTASLAALVQHLPETDRAQVDMTRFRPNLVLDGLEPFEEDALYKIRIGDVVLQLVKPCARCKITTICQQTGETLSNEPLKTLTKLRRGKSDDLAGAFFGQNAVPETCGMIRKGDKVEILERRTPHPALADAILKFA